MTTATENPLLTIQFEIPFDQIRAEHVEPAIESLLEKSRAGLEKIKSVEGPRTFENTMARLEEATEHLEYAMGIVRHLEAVDTSPELRDAYKAVEGPVSEFFSSIPLDDELWEAIKSFSETDEAGELDPTARRFLKKTKDDFKRHGAELPPEEKKRLSEINVRLSELTTRFRQNVLDATNDFEVIIEDEEGLSGLPESAIEAARERAKEKEVDGWRFTLQAPSYIPVMTYLDDESVRKEVYLARASRCNGGEYDNREIMAEILKLRREKANLLGFDTFADLVLDDRMAKNGDSAREFVDDLQSKVREYFEKENEELQAFKAELTGDDSPLQAWEVGYYAEKLRKKNYAFDKEELRPYFAMEKVLDGLFEVAHRLFDIRIEPTELPVWHEAVRTFAIFDADGTHLASFYADFHPREEKRGGAWMNYLITGLPKEDAFSPHLGLVCGNMTPPVGEKPALLTHSEVSTLFHEFGHLLHHCLSNVSLRSLAGTNVAWDFVELPSQIMENWVWEREALDLFARHYETNEPIPTDLYEKMVGARNFRSGYKMMRQLGFGTVDLALHIDFDPDREEDVVEYANEILKRFSPAPLPENYGMIAAFQHLFASPVGYGAGYYSYKWAEVLDADAFTRFQKEGIFNRETGLAFRRTILSRGNSDEPMNLYKKFMGREPEAKALLVRAGLA